MVVHTSTRQVYGRPRYLPVDEDHPTSPVDINGVDKLAGEQFHMLYHVVHGLKTASDFSPFSFVGPFGASRSRCMATGCSYATRSISMMWCRQCA
jgi:nucleoside-diphosphate-sugar epimerase